MNMIGEQNTWHQFPRFVAAAILATTFTTAAAEADPLPVYGGPTYSSTIGGYLAESSPILSVLQSGHVNDAGMAAATIYKFDGTQLLGTYVIRWSASSSFVELDSGFEPRFSYNPDRATRINAAGTVVGSTRVPDVLSLPNQQGNPQYRPARWDASGTAVTVLEHPYTWDSSATASASTFATDINDSGNAVGMVYRSSVSHFQVIDEGFRAARWDASGTALTQLGHLGTDPDGYAQGAAQAVNAAGHAVGFAQKYDAEGNYLGYRAVRWDAASTAAVELGVLGTLANNPWYAPDGFTNGQAVAINSAGMVVGQQNVYDDAGQLVRQDAPVRWDAFGTPTLLGDLGSNDAIIARTPAALNDAGTAVGRVTKVADDGTYLGRRAVRWDASSAVAVELGNLGTFPDGRTFGEALAVNAAGTAVGMVEGFSNTGASIGERAVYWGTDTVAVDLNTLIDPSSGWVLTRAYEISDTGWIVGRGLFDPDGAGGQASYFRHFLMQVPATAIPEPGTGGLLVFAVALATAHFAGRRRTH